MLKTPSFYTLFSMAAAIPPKPPLESFEATLYFEGDKVLKVWKERMFSPFNHTQTVHRLTRHIEGINHPTTIFLEPSPGMTFPYLEGPNYEDLVLSSPPLPLSRVKELMEEPTRTLLALHEEGYVHGDFKPDNIVGGKLIDLTTLFVPPGSLSLPPDSPAYRFFSFGTYTYRAPEAYLTPYRLTQAIDVWAWGLSLYMMATGGAMINPTSEGVPGIAENTRHQLSLLLNWFTPEELFESPDEAPPGLSPTKPFDWKGHLRATSPSPPHEVEAFIALLSPIFKPAPLRPSLATVYAQWIGASS